MGQTEAEPSAALAGWLGPRSPEVLQAGVWVLCADVGEHEVGLGSGQILVREVTDVELHPHAVNAVEVQVRDTSHLDWVKRVGVHGDVERLERAADAR